MVAHAETLQISPELELYVKILGPGPGMFLNNPGMLLMRAQSLSQFSIRHKIGSPTEEARAKQVKRRS